MAVLIHNGKSPFYYIRYYDKLQPQGKRRQKISTKIKLTPADQKIIEESKGNGKSIRLKGNREVHELLKQFNKSLLIRNLEKNAHIIIKEDITLQEGLNKFIAEKTVSGDSEAIKPKTVTAYESAVNKYIEANGNQLIKLYTREHSNAFLQHLEKANLKPNSRGIHTRHLSALWNFFVEMGHAVENPIKIYRPDVIPAVRISNDEMIAILRALYKRYGVSHPQRFQIIYFMRLTGVRPSSALEQRCEWIDLEAKQIRILNVKPRKKNKFYFFPITDEMLELLKGMDINRQGRLFDQLTIQKNYSNSIKIWWGQTIADLLKDGEIKMKYTLQHIRETFANHARNELKMPDKTVSTLLHHESDKVTKLNYLVDEMDIVRETLNSKRVYLPEIKN